MACPTEFSGVFVTETFYGDWRIKIRKCPKGFLVLFKSECSFCRITNDVGLHDEVPLSYPTS